MKENKQDLIENVIRFRRAVYPKQFNGNEVPKEIIDKMIELANWAPTHKNTEPWRFKIFKGKSLNLLIDQCKDYYTRETPSEQFKPNKINSLEQRKKQVSHVIAICMNRSEIIPEFEEIASTAMAVQNMWLYLSSTKKYGCYWSTPEYSLGKEFNTYLGLSNNQRCLGLFYVGCLDENLELGAGKRGDWQHKVIKHQP